MQIKLLDQFGMRWENVRDVAWEKYYAAAKQYFAEQGDSLVNISDNKIHAWFLDAGSLSFAPIEKAIFKVLT